MYSFLLVLTPVVLLMLAYVFLDGNTLDTLAMFLINYIAH
jgi:hypothetical protein